jgi:signal transduction histidine kinase
MESLQKELTIAGQEKRLFIIIISFVTVTLILLLTLLIVIQKRRRAMAQQIERDRQIQKLQEDNIESQQRELSTHALILSEKTELLKQIDVHIKTLPKDNADVKAIKKIIQGNLTTEESWENFMLHFNKVHPHFFEKLKARSPALTENNLRLCAYLRISMNSKHIAQVLNMSHDNVRKSIYRIKKKLSLDEDDN